MAFGNYYFFFVPMIPEPRSASDRVCSERISSFGIFASAANVLCQNVIVDNQLHTEENSKMGYL